MKRRDLFKSLLGIATGVAAAPLLPKEPAAVKVEPPKEQWIRIHNYTSGATCVQPHIELYYRDL